MGNRPKTLFFITCQIVSQRASSRPKPASKKRKSASSDSDGEGSAFGSGDSAAGDSSRDSVSPAPTRGKGGHAEGHASSTQVTEYENQIHGDHWPLDCIKCNVLIGNLDNFNIHMNDHWSDDKCCPVCGLLINSKRFNFKQHLKIHTGEKPFVCQVRKNFEFAFVLIKNNYPCIFSLTDLQPQLPSEGPHGQAHDYPPDRRRRRGGHRSGGLKKARGIIWKRNDKTFAPENNRNNRR